MTIQVLPPEVASKIAAGEVVERPASVVKELLDNALDAGATQIEVEVRGGGLETIRVRDNGHGMSPEEAPLAFERHATSKIVSAEDLSRVRTLGFRGEALPSIAAVADVVLVTRRRDDLAATKLTLRDGHPPRPAVAAGAPGTTIEVARLFRRLPARRKFLRTPSTEASHISEVVTHYALAFPGVRFGLDMDGREAFRSPGTGDLRDAAAAVYGADTAAALVPVGEAKQPVWGLISPPSLSRANRSYVGLFVNQRWVKSRSLSFAVSQAYHDLLPSGRYPVVILHLSLPLEEVDVNVHPQKTEVRFLREREVFAALQRAMRGALVGNSPVPRVERKPGPAAPTPQPPRHGSPPLREEAPATQAALPGLPALRVLGQVSATYIIAEGPEGVYLVDQHAAHERVLYEKLRRERAEQCVEVQGLLSPCVVELTPRQAQLAGARGEALAQHGFQLEPFGAGSYLLRALPSMLSHEDPAEAVRRVLDSLLNEEPVEEAAERLAASIACHSAVRAGQPLGLEEARELVRQLENAASPLTCPHGRPTMIHLSAAQLEREFGRR